MADVNSGDRRNMDTPPPLHSGQYERQSRSYSQWEPRSQYPTRDQRTGTVETKPLPDGATQLVFHEIMGDSTITMDKNSHVLTVDQQYLSQSKHQEYDPGTGLMKLELTSNQNGMQYLEFDSSGALAYTLKTEKKFGSTVSSSVETTYQNGIPAQVKASNDKMQLDLERTTSGDITGTIDLSADVPGRSVHFYKDKSGNLRIAERQDI